MSHPGVQLLQSDTSYVCYDHDWYPIYQFLVITDTDRPNDWGLLRWLQNVLCAILWGKWRRLMCLSYIELSCHHWHVPQDIEIPRSKICSTRDLWFVLGNACCPCPAHSSNSYSDSKTHVLIMIFNPMLDLDVWEYIALTCDVSMVNWEAMQLFLRFTLPGIFSWHLACCFLAIGMMLRLWKLTDTNCRSGLVKWYTRSSYRHAWSLKLTHRTHYRATRHVFQMQQLQDDLGVQYGHKVRLLTVQDDDKKEEMDLHHVVYKCCKMQY